MINMIHVPDEARWLAKDQNGSWNLFSNKPSAKGRNRMWFPNEGGNAWGPFYNITCDLHWRKCLFAVNTFIHE